MLKRQEFVILLVGLGLIACRFWPLLIGKTLFWGDNYSLYVPGRLYTATAIKQGVLPLWNPTILGGISWIGDINQSIFYFATLPFMWLPTGLAMNVLIILHVLIGFYGMYRLSREVTGNQVAAIIAAILWSFSTQVTGALNNGVTMQSMAYVPFVLWGGYRLGLKQGSALLLIVAGCFALLGGYPQYLLYTYIFGFIWSYFTREVSLWLWFRRWVVAGIVTFGLCSFFVWPFVETINLSTRTAQSDYQALTGSLKLPNVFKIILPSVFDKLTEGMRWGPSWSGHPNVFMYVTWIGLFAVIFFVLSKKLVRDDYILLGLIGLTLLVSLGSSIPGLSFFFTSLPIIKLGRYPSMILMITNLFLSLEVGWALVRLKLTQRQFLFWFSMGGLLIVVGGILWFIWSTQSEYYWALLDRLIGMRLSSSLFHTYAKDQIIVNVILENWFLNSVFFGLMLVTVRMKKMKLLILLTAFDMAYNTNGLLLYAPLSIYDNQEAESKHIATTMQNLQGYQYRTLTRNMNVPYADFDMYWEAYVIRSPFSDSFVDQTELLQHNHLRQLQASLTPDWNMPAGIRLINGYTSLVPLNLARMWPGVNEARINFLGYINPADTLLNHWSVKYYLVDTNFGVKENLSYLQEVTKNDMINVYEIPGALPRVRWQNQTGTQIYDYNETPNEISFSVESPGDTLVLADRYEPNWQVTIDELENSPLTNCEQLRCVYIPAGRHRLNFTYQPKTFYFGLAISSMFLIGLLYGEWQKRHQYKPK